jgi:DNA topoisomerase-1
MYELIWKRTVQSCLPAAQGWTITAHVSAPHNLAYHHKAETIDVPGWRVYESSSSSSSSSDTSSSSFSYLRSLPHGFVVPIGKIKADIHIIDRPLHYTEAKWVSLLEERGIGRPSTFSHLIDKVLERGYVEKRDVPGNSVEYTHFLLENGVVTETVESKEMGAEKNKIVLTPLGEKVYEFLRESFGSILHYDYTKQMEDALDGIAQGQKRIADVCGPCFSLLQQKGETIKKEKGQGEEKRRTTKQKEQPKKGKKENPNIVRTWTPHASIRSGPYGDYVFYKTDTMKQPRFFSLEGYDGNYKTGSLDLVKSWLADKYQIRIR